MEYSVARRYTDSKGKKTMHIMREYYSYYNVGVAVPKYMPYLASFNRIIVGIPDSGIYLKWMQDIIRNAKEIDAKNRDKKVCAIC